jgi:hypothetical protein
MPENVRWFIVLLTRSPLRSLAPFHIPILVRRTNWAHHAPENQFCQHRNRLRGGSF